MATYKPPNPKPLNSNPASREGSAPLQTSCCLALGGLVKELKLSYHKRFQGLGFRGLVAELKLSYHKMGIKGLGFSCCLALGGGGGGGWGLCKDLR